jgi:hypothetical protein
MIVDDVSAVTRDYRWESTDIIYFLILSLTWRKETALPCVLDDDEFDLSHVEAQLLELVDAVAAHPGPIVALLLDVAGDGHQLDVVDVFFSEATTLTAGGVSAVDAGSVLATLDDRRTPLFDVHPVDGSLALSTNHSNSSDVAAAASVASAVSST